MRPGVPNELRRTSGPPGAAAEAGAPGARPSGVVAPSAPKLVA